MLMPICDIFRKRPMEENRVLRYKTYAAAQTPLRNLRNVLAIDRNASRLNIVEPLKEFDERTLPTARVTDERNFFSGFDIERKVLEHRMSCLLVRKCDIAECDSSAWNAKHGGLGFIHDRKRQLVQPHHFLRMRNGTEVGAYILADVAHVAPQSPNVKNDDDESAGSKLSAIPQPHGKQHNRTFEENEERVVAPTDNLTESPCLP